MLGGKEQIPKEVVSTSRLFPRQKQRLLRFLRSSIKTVANPDANTAKGVSGEFDSGG
jgi:hypothetical protein